MRRHRWQKVRGETYVRWEPNGDEAHQVKDVKMCIH